VAQTRVGVKKREQKSNKCIYDTLEQGHVQLEEGVAEQEAWDNSTHKPLVPGRYLSEGRIKYIKDMDPILHKPAV